MCKKLQRSFSWSTSLSCLFLLHRIWYHYCYVSTCIVVSPDTFSPCCCQKQHECVRPYWSVTHFTHTALDTNRYTKANRIKSSLYVPSAASRSVGDQSSWLLRLQTLHTCLPGLSEGSGSLIIFTVYMKHRGFCLFIYLNMAWNRLIWSMKEMIFHFNVQKLPYLLPLRTRKLAPLRCHFCWCFSTRMIIVKMCWGTGVNSTRSISLWSCNGNCSSFVKASVQPWCAHTSVISHLAD